MSAQTIEGVAAGDVMRWQAFNAQAIKAVQAGNPGEAVLRLEEALTIHRDPYVLGNYGDALARSGRIADAKGAFLEALELKPDYDMAHYNLGVVHDQEGDYEASREHYLNALSCRVTAAALNNLANAETFTLRLADAEHHYRKAVKQGYFDAFWNLGLCLMMQGKWAEGWDLYEHRPQMRDMAGHPLRWRGENVAGKKMVILTEQGLGDTVYVLRYIPMLRERGAHLMIGCESTLKRLVEAMCPASDTLPPVRVFDRMSQQLNEPFDYLTNAMSLPGYLTPEGTGSQHPYLVARAARSEGFTVGLCWNGSTVVGPPKERNIPLKLLKPLSEIEGVKLVSLQKGNAAAEMDDCGFEIHDAMSGAHDVYDTACVIASLDLVITVDTLIPHIAGGLGKPTWLLNRYMSCWQWGTQDYDPKLYASVVQFRQKVARDWTSPITHVTYGLKHLAESMGLAEAK